MHRLCSQRTDNPGRRWERHTKQDKTMTARHKVLQWGWGERKNVELPDLGFTGGDNFSVDRDCVVYSQEEGTVCTGPCGWQQQVVPSMKEIWLAVRMGGSESG